VIFALARRVQRAADRGHCAHPSIGAAIASATGSYPALFVILAAATAGAVLAAAAPVRGADATAQAGDLATAPSPGR
jgi:hypothetical protein